MKETVLTFPDIDSLADFIFEQNISNALVDTKEHKVEAILSDDQIVVASTYYSAELRFSNAFC